MSFSANLLIKLMASPISQNMLKERSILGVQIAKKWKLFQSHIKLCKTLRRQWMPNTCHVISQMRFHLNVTILPDNNNFNKY